MSAVEDSADGPVPVIQVLFALHPSFGAQELCGPLEVLSNAYHKIKDPSKSAISSFLQDMCPFLSQIRASSFSVNTWQLTAAFTPSYQSLRIHHSSHIPRRNLLLRPNHQSRH